MGCAASKAGGLYEKPTREGVKDDREKTKQFEEDLHFIERVPLFSRLSKADLPIVVGALERREYKSEDFVIREGAEGNEFFLIKQGEATVLKGNENIATLKPGDYFGEASLLEDTPRNATVKVTKGKSLTVLCLTRSKFEELGVRDRLRFPRRKAVAAHEQRPAQEHPSEDQDVSTQQHNLGPEGRRLSPAEKEKLQEKDGKAENLIRDALLANKYLSKVLSKDQVEDMVSVAYSMKVKKGEEVVKEGSLFADRFYIVSSGKFEIRKMIETTKSSGIISLEESLEGELSTGNTFGELALLYNAPRAATVEATTDATLFVIDRQDFKQILRKQAQQRSEFYMKLVEKTELLRVLLKEEKEALVECFVQLHYQGGQTVLKEGEEGDTFYIMYQGTVGVYSEEKGKVATLSADPENCQYFGEAALVNPEKRNASIIVESHSVSCLVLSRSTFEQILGPLKEILQEKTNLKRTSMLHKTTTKLRDQQASGGSACSSSAQSQKFAKPKFGDLNRVGVLGCGGFGSVTLQRVKGKSKALYALKAISKGYILKMQLCDQICNERKILSMTNSPFIAQFYCTYNSADTLYFLLEACLGGEVFAQYSRRSFHGSVPHCVFYSACVVKAFEHLHDRKIIYRDLKPENMLLDDVGYCKLTDMGLAKFVVGRTYTTCGTPDYFAPEIIQSVGHTNAVDWWTFGILVYELLVGRTPFDGIDPQLRYRKILGGIDKSSFPKTMPKNAVEMIKEVCRTDPSHRLPMRPGGVRENLYTCTFYEFNKWAQLERRALKPPFKPRLKASNPLYQFGSGEGEIQPPTIAYVDPKNGWDADF
mmetsp:Transcript_16773/g.41536  ORF Transcript_16773/g.41536 Transcript_16773/m.41536 type:complete len:821 (+) Transcript_16773:174-2636(+)|eukprot:CAMPEP_0178993768 /NCGR_PEP_ID=MMETSP0795-20121207/6890_1 /TAXON_ID=88552 /ORGANISM="Amoebophrya sp., Strain Ameob2" /LENGTH=820 /DNA_ID=CAMNT_0020685871 /DNA_START=91 /DNA_END=2553 /DNA_ORIENTATION=+